MEHSGYSRCSRKFALSVFFSVEVLAFTICLLSLLSPSWQWVGLERGRTEHHHGLWLDCKRDYSFDYGREREYYETLYRRDYQGTPFDVFILPTLECVYKFDYYIDPEDLYDHNHDENRLQDDAYQHLFLGHKIASLSACGVGVVLSGVSLLLGICSFCHRTFIAASTSLVTLASFLSFAGVGAFYGWASNQDNSVIKQQAEQETYEQHLGWAFYFQLVGAILHLFAGSLGCFATSIAFSKSRAKLVRIDVVESGATSSHADLLSSALNLSDNAPFKRSFSAIYRVDSTSLQQWEKDYAKKVRETQDSFVRTKSMPMLGKRQSLRKKRGSQKRVSLADNRSSSNLFLSSGCETGETTTGTTNTMESISSHRHPPSIPTPQPPKQLKSALKSDRRFASTYKINRGTDSGNDPGLDTTYEYLPCDQPMRNAGVSSFLTGKSQKGVYDSVYDYEPGDFYLEPNSRAEARRSTSTLNTLNSDAQQRSQLPGMALPSGSVQSIPFSSREETLIDDVIRPSTSIDDRGFDTRNRIREMETIEELQRIERKKRSRPKPPPKPPTVSKPSGSALLPPPSTTTFQVNQHPLPPRTPDPMRKPILGPRELGIAPGTSNGYGYCSSIMSDSSPPRELTLNTFGASDHRGSTRSLTSLKFRPGFEMGGSAAEIFERPDSSVEPTLPSSSPASSTVSKREVSKPMNLHRKLLLGTLPDEVDRSIGSSTILENETLRESNSSPLSYARDAELRLNLFLSDPVISSPSASSHRPNTRSDSDSNETTV
ncbi:hypothetical protein PENTCL1PPCAC_17683 [Pristionchus entomophagus]|uniref:Uncharacterized protein n=1 Tax=Pristionchus entomophagus TaxID=358040 RepID=A0AAV5TMQ3_9BILA|nr:hypothetical protein PENTCL1PPCAC_17683 [Pristionchus entomophagus]